MLPISQITDEKVALEIGLPDELLDFARMVNSGELSGRADVKVRLTADIDLTGHQWTPIGLGKAQFAGRFDGGGHTISGVTIQKKWPGNYGLFGYVTGTIQNVTVTGTIYNRSGEPHSAVGGIVGDLAGGVVRNCAADLVIDSNRRSLGFFAGERRPGAELPLQRPGGQCPGQLPLSRRHGGGRHGLPRGALHLHRGHHRPGRRDLLHRRRGHRGQRPGPLLRDRLSEPGRLGRQRL